MTTTQTRAAKPAARKAARPAKPKTRTAAELRAMSEADFRAYVAAGGELADLMREAKPSNAAPGPVDVPAVDIDSEPMRVQGFRLPVWMLEELRRLAGNDKAGMSGLVRIAIEEMLNAHPDACP
jgi:hypothetical protein